MHAVGSCLLEASHLVRSEPLQWFRHDVTDVHLTRLGRKFGDWRYPRATLNECMLLSQMFLMSCFPRYKLIDTLHSSYLRIHNNLIFKLGWDYFASSVEKLSGIHHQV